MGLNSQEFLGILHSLFRIESQDDTLRPGSEQSQMLSALWFGENDQVAKSRGGWEGSHLSPDTESCVGGGSFLP